jgi:hypothetical protein
MRIVRLAVLVCLALMITSNVYAQCTGCLSTTCTVNGKEKSGLVCIKDTAGLPPGDGILNCRNVANCSGCWGGVCSIQPSGARKYVAVETVITTPLVSATADATEGGKLKSIADATEK